MSWMIYVSLSIGLYTALNISSKLFTLDSRNQRAFAFVFGVISATFATILSIVDAGGKFSILPTSWFAWIIMLIACLAYAINERVRFAIAKNLDASIIPIIYTVAPLVAFIGAVIFYHEAITLPRLLGIGLIILATMMITVSNGRSDRKNLNLRYVGIAFMAAGALGVAWMLDKQGIANFGIQTYNIFVWVIPSILVFLPSIKIDDLKFEFKTGVLKIAILAILNVLGYYLSIKAMALTDLTNVVALSQLSLVTTVIIGIIFLREREFAWVKIGASIIAFAGAYLIV